MTVLELSPCGLLSKTYVISANGSPIGEVDSSAMREQATVKLGDMVYAASRESVLSGAFFLEADGQRLASAEKPSALRSSFNVRIGGKAYVFEQPKKLFARNFVLSDNGREIGSVVTKGLTRSQATATFPDDLPPHGQAFLIWLVIVIWNRAKSSD
jgi:hypothetical protein